MSKKTCFDMRG